MLRNLRLPEPPEGSLQNAIVIVLTILVGAALHDWWFPKERKVLAPPEIRERVAECILTNDSDACAFAESIKGSYPVQK